MLPFTPWLVWIIPVVSSLFVPFVERLGGKARNCYAVAVGLVTTVFALSMVPDVFFGTVSNVDSTVSWIPGAGISFGVRVDPLSVFFASIVAFFSLIVLIYSMGYMAHENGLARYYFFMLLFMGSMIGLVMADNFLQMFLFWEVIGLCSYLLVSFWYKRPEAVRAGVKVFLITRVGDVCLLGAIVLLYASLGSFSFSYTMDHISEVSIPVLSAVAFLILGGAIAKSAQLPLHTWLYSAMEAPTSVSALLHGATLVKAGVYLVARFFVLAGVLVTLIPMWLSSLAWIGAITAVVGALLALRTPDIKGVPAYSTISQIGFMMAALGAATSASSEGWFASLFHLISHAFFQGLGFLAIGGIIHALGTRDMRQMGGLRKMLPITFILCIIVLFARTGVPPFASFFSKGLIISSLWSTSDILLVLTIYGALAITFAYTLRFTILVFFRKPSEYIKQSHIHEPPRTMLFASGILAALCLVWGFLANYIAQFMQVNIVFGVNEIFSSSTLIFLLCLLIGGLPVYLFYYRPRFAGVVTRRLAVLNVVLDHGFFFDDFYEKIIAGGIRKVSDAVGYLEVTFFTYLPYAIAKGVKKLGYGTRKYSDAVIERVQYIAAGKGRAYSLKLRRTDEESIQDSIAAALLGLLIIIAVILITGL